MNYTFPSTGSAWYETHGFGTSSWVYMVCTVILILSITRVLSAQSSSSVEKDGHGTMEIQLLPYWIPFIGHIPQLILWPERLLKGTRDNLRRRAFALNIAGKTHNLLWSPGMVQSVFAQRPSVVNFDSLTWFFLHNVGGVPSQYRSEYDKVIHPLVTVTSNHLMKEVNLREVFSRTVRNFEDNLPNLVSFMDHLIDQNLWERESNAVLAASLDDEPAMEVNLLSLVITFLAHAAIPPFFGSDFLRNYPDVLPSLWAFNTGFFHLALGLPRFFPLPACTAAHNGRRRIAAALTSLHAALDAEAAGHDPGPTWPALHDVSALVRARGALYREHGVPPGARADLSLLWALNANSNFLAFWVLLRILQDGQLVAAVRAETQPFVKVEGGLSAEEREVFRGVEEAPRVRIDEARLCRECALLKACVVESVRMDSETWSLKSVVKDFTVVDDAGEGEDAGAKYRIRAGSYVDVPQVLHFTDPTYFPNPEKWDPTRHIVSKGDDDTHSPTGAKEARWGSIKPFGGGSSICPGRVYAEREVMTFVAGVLALWDFEPVHASGWRVPGHGRATGVSMPKEDVRVRVTRRRAR